MKNKRRNVKNKTKIKKKEFPKEKKRKKMDLNSCCLDIR